MRDREEIERELFEAREDLELAVGDLRHVVQEKLDVKARVQHAIEIEKHELGEALDAVKQRVVYEVKAHPATVALIALAVLAVAGTATYLALRQR